VNVILYIFSQSPRTKRCTVLLETAYFILNMFVKLPSAKHLSSYVILQAKAIQVKSDLIDFSSFAAFLLLD